jgi:hypothetical protein
VIRNVESNKNKFRRKGRKRLETGCKQPMTSALTWWLQVRCFESEAQRIPKSTRRWLTLLISGIDHGSAFCFAESG